MMGDCSALLKAASDEHRLTILCMLNQGERCVCEILPNLRIPQNLASHHLKILKNAELIKSRKSGQRVYYTVDPTNMKKLRSLLNHIFAI